jgi:hypothetical protein
MHSGAHKSVVPMKSVSVNSYTWYNSPQYHWTLITKLIQLVQQSAVPLDSYYQTYTTGTTVRSTIGLLLTNLYNWYNSPQYHWTRITKLIQLVQQSAVPLDSYYQTYTTGTTVRSTIGLVLPNSYNWYNRPQPQRTLSSDCYKGLQYQEFSLTHLL